MKSKAASRRAPASLGLLIDQLNVFQPLPVGVNVAESFAPRLTADSTIAPSGRLTCHVAICPPIPLTYEDPKSVECGISLKLTVIAVSVACPPDACACDFNARKSM